MTTKGIYKAGPITLALGLVIGGFVLLFYNFGVIGSLEWLWKLWPVLIIGIGVEYFVKRVLIRKEEVHIHVPSLLLILLLIISGGVFYAATNIASNISSFMGGIPFHQTKLSYSRSWEAEPVEIKAGDKLIINNKVGLIKLLPAEGNELNVYATVKAPETGSSRQLAEKLNPDVKREDGQVYITVPEIDNIESGYVDNYVVTDLKVIVPAGVDVQIESDAGRVKADNMDINLIVAGATGTIELSEIKGNIKATNSTGVIDVANPGGNVLLENNTGTIELSSNRPLTGNYSIKNNTGKVNLNLPKESDLVINAETSTGRVFVHGIFALSGSAGEYNGKLGEGKGRADLKVGTGTIDINVR